MDSRETVTQQPVSTLLDLTNDIPDSREVRRAVVDSTLPYPTEPVTFRSKLEAAPVLAEQEVAVGETPTALQTQEETDRTDSSGENRGKLDGNGNVEKVVDSSVLVETVVLQQIKETVDIEVDITAPAADAENRSHDGTVVVASDIAQEAGQVELLIEQAGGKSNAEGIAVEVVLNEAGPAVSEAQLALVADGDGLGEIPTCVEICIIGTSSNVDEHGSSQSSVQTGGAGCTVGIEAVVVTDVPATVNSSVISLVDELAVHGAGTAAEMKELDVSPIVELEQVQVDKVVVSAVQGRDETAPAERNSTAVLRFEETTSIEEPQFPVKGGIAIPLIENVIQLGTGESSTSVLATDEEPLPSTVFEGALNAIDHSTADVINVDAPDTVKIFDRGVDIIAIAEEQLATRMVGGSAEESTMAAESDVVNPPEDVIADGLLDRVIAPQDVMEISREDGRIVVDLDASIGPEEGTGMEDFADLLVVPAAVEPEKDALNTGGPLTSTEIDISVEKSSIFVQLDDIPSETLEALQSFKGVEEEKSGKEDAIPSGDESVAGQSTFVGLSEDTVPVAISVAEPIEEPAALMSASDVPSNLAMPDIHDTSTGEPSIVGEPGKISTNTPVPLTLEENLSIGVGVDTVEELPPVESTGPTAAQEIFDNPTATHPIEREEELIISEEVKLSETSCLNAIETANIPASTDKPNVEEIQMKVSVSTDEMETSRVETVLTNETARETLTQTPVDKIQEGSAMESAERTQEQPAIVTFQELNTKVEENAGISWEESLDNIINAVEEEDDTEMLNAPSDEGVEAGDPLTITESMLREEGIVLDDLINPPLGMVAIEETTETTTSVTRTALDSGGAAAEDVDGHGVLIGVGSSVESRGLTITEIAETTVIVEEFRAERQSSWGLSEPLITPPEEEIIEAIGDLVDNTITDMEPEIAEGLVPQDNSNSESTDLPTASVEGDTPSETIHIQNENLQVLDDVEQLEKNPNDTAAVAMVASNETGNGAEPLDLQDARSLLTTSTLLQTETAADSAKPLVSPPENKQPTVVTAEIALESLAQEHLTDPLICAPEDKLPKDLGAAIAVESVDQGLENVPVAIAEVENGLPEADNFPAVESGPVSIAMSSYDAEKLSSMQGTAATDLMEQVTSVVKDNPVEGASDIVAPSANGLGLNLEAALDSSELSCEAKAMVSADTVVTPVELDMERNEKKRGREEEAAMVEAENKEKTAKAAKTSNGEISVVNDAEAKSAKTGEDVQVDKKRSRDELETASEEPDAGSPFLLVKAQKTGSGDDDAGSLSRKTDNDGEADAEECVEMEDKEEVKEKNVNGARQPRYKKKKIALFLGYSGAGYQGMQKNPGAITIEGELEEALFRAGAIAESNYGQPSKLDWRRAARTDKGVSAVGQVVSGCFFIDPPGFIERVNSHLPKQIRVYGYKRATASFSAKKFCDRRKYEYVLPVYAFDPSVHLDRETAQALAAAEKVLSVNETETITTVTQISGSAAETEAPMVIDNGTKESAVTEEGTTLNGGTGSVIGNPEIERKDNNQSCSNGMCTITEEVTSTITNVMNSSSAADAEASMASDIQMKESAATEDGGGVNGGNDSVTGNPEVEGKEDKTSSSNGMCAITEKVTAITEITQEVTSIDTGVNPSPEEKEALDEKASTVPGEVLVQIKEVITKREEVTVTETVANLTTEEKREALDEKIKKSTYAFGDDELNRLNRILSGFVGHHNFHNFTVRTKATDPSANRNIISFEVENTFTKDGIEFVRCSVVGQSFMLHQIRKMIGLVVAIMRGAAPESILATALRRDTDMNVPMAPELGLFLEECYYTAYNKKFHATHEEMSLNSFADEANEFKKEFIYPHIISTEATDSTFAMWLHSLNDRHYPHFDAARKAEKLVKA